MFEVELLEQEAGVFPATYIVKVMARAITLIYSIFYDPSLL